MQFKKWLFEVGGQNDQPDLQPVSALIASNRGAIWTHNTNEIPPVNWSKKQGPRKSRPPEDSKLIVKLNKNF